MFAKFRLSHLLQVQADSSHDVLIGRQSLGNDVCVIHDVTTKEKAATTSIDKVHCLAKRNDEPDDTRHHCQQMIRYQLRIEHVIRTHSGQQVLQTTMIPFLRSHTVITSTKDCNTSSTIHYLGLKREQSQAKEDTEGDQPESHRSKKRSWEKENSRNAYKACNTIKLLKNATITPRVKASINVKVDSKTKLSGWLWRFQYKNPRLIKVPKRGMKKDHEL